VPAGHPVLALAGPAVFLGLDDGQPRFAADLSDWSPEAGADAPDAGFFDATVQRHPAFGGDEGFVELRGVMTRLTPREAELVATAKALLQWHRSHGFCSACGAPSDMAHGRLAAHCPACGRAAFPAHRPGGHHAGHPREFGPSRPQSRLARGHVLAAGGLRRTRRDDRGRRPPRGAGGNRRALRRGLLPRQPALALPRLADDRARGPRHWAATSSIDPEELEQALWVTREELVQAFAGLHPGSARRAWVDCDISSCATGLQIGLIDPIFLAMRNGSF
jgi:NAD+ diphosphatase